MWKDMLPFWKFRELNNSLYFHFQTLLTGKHSGLSILLLCLQLVSHSLWCVLFIHILIFRSTNHYKAMTPITNNGNCFFVSKLYQPSKITQFVHFIILCNNSMIRWLNINSQQAVLEKWDSFLRISTFLMRMLGFKLVSIMTPKPGVNLSDKSSCHSWGHFKYLVKGIGLGFPWWLSGKRITAYRCRRHGLNPWPGKIPCSRKTKSPGSAAAVAEHCSIEPKGTTVEAMCHSYWTSEPRAHGNASKKSHREVYASPLECGPWLPQRKSLQQQRPRMVKK